MRAFDARLRGLWTRVNALMALKSGMGQALPGFDPSFQPSQPLLVLRSSSARDAVCWAGMVPPQGFEPRIPRCKRGALAAKLRRHRSAR